MSAECLQGENVFEPNGGLNSHHHHIYDCSSVEMLSWQSGEMYLLIGSEFAESSKQVRHNFWNDGGKAGSKLAAGIFERG